MYRKRNVGLQVSTERHEEGVKETIKIWKEFEKARRDIRERGAQRQIRGVGDGGWGMGDLGK